MGRLIVVSSDEAKEKISEEGKLVGRRINDGFQKLVHCLRLYILYIPCPPRPRENFGIYDLLSTEVPYSPGQPPHGVASRGDLKARG